MAFFTTFTKVTQATSGAPRISGTQGDLTTFLDWLLVTIGGWAILFTAANERVYQAPSGNRCPLYVNDNTAFTGDARLTVVRACASATGIGTANLVDPFPTVGQVADASCNWHKSTVASTTARNYFAYVFDWGFYLAINSDATADNFPMYMYTDTVERISGDSWGTVLYVRNSTVATSSQLGINGVGNIMQAGPNGALGTNLFQMRNASGAIKSSRAHFHGLGTAAAALGLATGAPAILAGVGNSIDFIQASTTDIASTTITAGSIPVINRGYIPNMRIPVHSSLVGVDETGDFEQSSHDPLARFRLFKCVSSAAGVIIEETNTWLGTSTG